MKKKTYSSQSRNPTQNKGLRYIAFSGGVKNFFQWAKMNLIKLSSNK